jgi:hypothetical protein
VTGSAESFPFLCHISGEPGGGKFAYQPFASLFAVSLIVLAPSTRQLKLNKATRAKRRSLFVSPWMMLRPSSWRFNLNASLDLPTSTDNLFAALDGAERCR